MRATLRCAARGPTSPALRITPTRQHSSPPTSPSTHPTVVLATLPIPLPLPPFPNHVPPPSRPPLRPPVNQTSGATATLYHLRRRQPRRLARLPLPAPDVNGACGGRGGLAAGLGRPLDGSARPPAERRGAAARGVRRARDHRAALLGRPRQPVRCLLQRPARGAWARLLAPRVHRVGRALGVPAEVVHLTLTLTLTLALTLAVTLTLTLAVTLTLTLALTLTLTLPLPLPLTPTRTRTGRACSSCGFTTRWPPRWSRCSSTARGRGSPMRWV